MRPAPEIVRNPNRSSAEDILYAAIASLVASGGPPLRDRAKSGRCAYGDCERPSVVGASVLPAPRRGRCGVIEFVLNKAGTVAHQPTCRCGRMDPTGDYAYERISALSIREMRSLMVARHIWPCFCLGSRSDWSAVIRACRAAGAP